MNLLWLAHEGGTSGANICLLEYMQILRDRGYSQRLIVPALGGLAEKALALDIPVDLVPYYSWTSTPALPVPGLVTSLRRWLRNRIAIKRIEKLIKSYDSHFVLTNTIAISVGARAAAGTGKKHIWFVHEFGEEDHGFTIAGSFPRGAGIMDRLSYKIVYNSLAVQKKFAPFIDPGKGCLVSYPLLMPLLEKMPVSAEERPAPPFPDGKLNLIMLGQIAPSKDLLEAIAALAICRDRGLSFTLHIVGKADQPAYLQELEEAIRSAGLTEQVAFLGPSSEPVMRLRENHVLLMCSRMEAFGRVTVEALKTGLPVIAANTGGSLELIRDGENGFLYSKGDPEALAARIRQIYQEYERFDRDRIAADAERAFNASRTILQLEKVLS